MVEKKPPKGVNKSAEIRKVATAMKDKGEKPRPVVIIATLKSKGIDVVSPQVSNVLKQMGFRRRKRRKSGTSPKATAAARKAAPGRAVDVSVEDLIAAKRVVGQFGGADRALAAIAALKRFES